MESNVHILLKNMKDWATGNNSLPSTSAWMTIIQLLYICVFEIDRQIGR